MESFFVSVTLTKSDYYISILVDFHNTKYSAKFTEPLIHIYKKRDIDYLKDWPCQKVKRKKDIITYNDNNSNNKIIIV